MNFIKLYKPNTLKFVPIGIMHSIRLVEYPYLKYISFNCGNDSPALLSTGCYTISETIRLLYQGLMIEFHHVKENINMSHFNQMVKDISKIDIVVLNIMVTYPYQSVSVLHGRGRRQHVKQVPYVRPDDELKVISFMSSTPIKTLTSIKEGHQFLLTHNAKYHISFLDKLPNSCTYEDLPLLGIKHYTSFSRHCMTNYIGLQHTESNPNRGQGST